MRSRALCLSLAGLALGAAGPAFPDAPPPGFVDEVLPNGLEVTILPDPTNPVVAVQVWYHVGAANEEPKTRGFAHLFEHLMFGPTTTHAKEDFAEYVRSHGGQDNAYTSWDETVYHEEIPPPAQAGLFDFEADRMVRLDLDERNLANEKRIVTEELRVTTENDPIVRAGVAVLKRVLDDHPYAVSPAGTKEDIAAATLDHAREFYARYYRPKNAHVVIVGPVDAAATMERVREAFGPLPADGVTPPDVPPLLGWPLPALVEVKEDLPPVKLAALGFALPPADHPDHWALVVMQQLLNGGAVDPFREELVRRRHKALEAGSMGLQLRRGGALVFFSAALPYRREKTAFRLLDETMAALGRYAWLTDDAVAAAKRKLLRREAQARWYAHERASQIGQARWWLGDARLAFSRADRIAAVTRADVQRVYEIYVVHGKPVRLHVAPEHVPWYVRLFGWLAPLVLR